MLSCFRSSSPGLGRFRQVILGIFCVLVAFPYQAQAVQDPKSRDANAGYEFSARMVSEIEGRHSEAQLFVKGKKYRLEPRAGIRTALGYAGVSIGRFDKQEVWLVLSRRRQVLVVPAQSEHRLLLSPELEGEIGRTFVGPSEADGRAAQLYEVAVSRGDGVERYYEWVDAEHGLVLKLMSQDREWLLEYQHVRFNPQPGYFFEPPLGYVPIDRDEIPKAQKRRR